VYAVDFSQYLSSSESTGLVVQPVFLHSAVGVHDNKHTIRPFAHKVIESQGALWHASVCSDASTLTLP